MMNIEKTFNKKKYMMNIHDKFLIKGIDILCQDRKKRRFEIL